MNQKQPKNEAFTGKQIDLFQSFYAQGHIDADDLSNTIELWDALPKYTVTRQAMAKMRTKDGLLNSLEKTYIYKGKSYNLKIFPALVDDGEEGEKAYY